MSLIFKFDIRFEYTVLLYLFNIIKIVGAPAHQPHVTVKYVLMSLDGREPNIHAKFQVNRSNSLRDDFRDSGFRLNMYRLVWSDKYNRVRVVEVQTWSNLSAWLIHGPRRRTLQTYAIFYPRRCDSQRFCESWCISFHA